MTFSINFSDKGVILFILGLLLLPGWARAEEIGKGAIPKNPGGMRLAIFPVENLTGSPAPLKEIKQTFDDQLRSQGVELLGEETLQKLMAKHRIRYTGGIDTRVARVFKEEGKTDGILILSLEFYSEAYPPKVSLLARLVSTDDPPVILWAEGLGSSSIRWPDFSPPKMERPSIRSRGNFGRWLFTNPPYSIRTENTVWL